MIGSGLGTITLLPATIIMTKAKFIGSFDGFINGIKTSLQARKEKENETNDHHEHNRLVRGIVGSPPFLLKTRA